MMRLIIVLFLMLPLFLRAQSKPELQVLKLSLDDDFFNYRGQGTDREYTAGTKIDFLYTSNNNKHNFFDKLLLQLSGNPDNLYGWGVAQLIFNPNNTSSQDIVYGDRPYAGVLYVNHSLISSDDIHKQKITTQLDIGVIGKYAFTEQIQNFVHNLIHYRDVEGWVHQITTDIIVNYFIEYEKTDFSAISKP